MLKDTTRGRLCGSNPGRLDSEFDALSLRQRAPNNVEILAKLKSSKWLQSFINVYFRHKTH